MRKLYFCVFVLFCFLFLLCGVLGEQTEPILMGVGEPGISVGTIAQGSYASSDESVVKIDAKTGELTALKPGTARISASGEELCTVRVLKAPSRLIPEEKTQYIMLGSTVPALACTGAEDEHVGTPEVRVSGTAVRLTADGQLYGADVGSAQVTLKSYNGLKATYTVYVRVKPKSFRLSEDTVTLGTGESFRLESTFEPQYSFSRVSWTAEDSEVIRFLDGTGGFVALRPGNTVITARTENGLEARCGVSVLPLPESIIAPETVQAAVGASGLLRCATPEGTMARLDYESLTPDILSVDKNGAWKVKTQGEGIVRVRAQGTDVSADIRFEIVPAAKSIAFESASLNMCVGQTQALRLTVRPEGAYESAEFTSSNPRCVTVDHNGVLTAVSQGKCTISAVAIGGARASVNITVLRQPDTIALKSEYLELAAGESAQLECTYSKNYYTPIAWRSLTPSVAQVDPDSGVVTALSGGSAAIEARGLNGQTAMCLITVDAPIEGPQELEIVFMDIDTNDGIILRSGDEYAFIDSGSHSYGEKAAAFMEEMGITHLKYYIGTHAHLDHIGGACVILSRFTVDMVIVPHAKVIRAIQGSVWTEEEREAAANAHYAVLPAGGRIYLGSVPFLCIGPIRVKNVETTDSAENDNSMVLRAEIGSKSVLLTGDATVSEFRSIIQAYPDKIRCDVYKNTHHAGELSDEQIRLIAPKIAIFSTSSLRLPATRYRKLFENLGSEIYITAERVNGNITLYTDGETITVTPQYENNRAAWDKAHGAAK